MVIFQFVMLVRLSAATWHPDGHLVRCSSSRRCIESGSGAKESIGACERKGPAEDQDFHVDFSTRFRKEVIASAPGCAMMYLRVAVSNCASMPISYNLRMNTPMILGHV